MSGWRRLRVMKTRRERRSSSGQCFELDRPVRDVLHGVDHHRAATALDRDETLDPQQIGAAQRGQHRHRLLEHRPGQRRVEEQREAVDAVAMWACAWSWSCAASRAGRSSAFVEQKAGVDRRRGRRRAIGAAVSSRDALGQRRDRRRRRRGRSWSARCGRRAPPDGAPRACGRDCRRRSAHRPP